MTRQPARSRIAEPEHSAARAHSKTGTRPRSLRPEVCRFRHPQETERQFFFFSIVADVHAPRAIAKPEQIGLSNMRKGIG